MSRDHRIALIVFLGCTVVVGMKVYSELFRFRDDVPHTPFGGVPAHVTGAGPATIIILHGYSGMPGDWAGVAELMASRWPVRVVMPRAPIRARGRGWAWFHRPRSRHARIRAIHDGRAYVDQVIDHARETGAEKIILIGHSMGARMTGDVGLSADPRLDGFALLAGARVPTWNLDNAGAQRIFIWHGRADRILDFDDAEETRDLLREHGAEVTWFEDEAGHDFSAEAQQALLTFIDGVL